MSSVVSGLGVVLVAISLLAVLGCEEDDEVKSLALSPSYTELSGSSTNLGVQVTVMDTLSDLSLPLKWSLSDGSLGSIVGASGSTATYVRFPNTPGVQEITVEDQFGSIGRSTIVQL